jgi:alkanesulfonate monooxygenase SsuD/methylene tetrahydromethanopterin reductase-like flavin-dependent oxidoreductase (luciferase family)
MGFRNPALLAKMADTLDEISGGRLILALGAGWHEPEFRAFGFPFDRRIARFEEGLRIVHALLREGRVDFDGAFYQVRGCELRPRGPRPNGPPLWVGTFGERMLRVTARYADAWNMEWTADAADTLPWRVKVDAACAEVGRDPATLARTACVMVDLPGWESRPGRDWITDLRADVGPATGSAEHLAAVLRGYAAAGIDHVQVLLAPNTLAGIEAFAPVLERLDRG